MTYPYEYSDAEKRLISTLKMEDVAMSPHQPPPLLFTWMAVQCFRDNRNDDVSTSVRNCLLAMEKAHTPGAICRLTPEFDKLILV